MSENLRSIVLNNKHINKNDTIVLALSGGIDSMVLFDVLYNLEIDLKIIVAHVNHQKRRESYDEYKEIELLCENKNVDFEGIELEPSNKGNFHDISRRERYKFFESIAEKYHSKKIILAHHLDDQIETVFMRIVRGSSLSGYSGIKEHRVENGFEYIRPLLNITKQEIKDYAKSKNISYYEDSSNSDDIYTRNRFRNTIIPLLKDENSNLEGKIKQFSSYITMADDFINNQRDKFIRENFNNGEVDLEAFNSLDDILKIKVLKFIINSKTFDTVEVSFNQYEDMIELLRNNNPNIKYNLSNGFVLVKVYKSFYIEKDLIEQSVSIEIEKPGEYIINNNLSYIFSTEKLGITHTDRIELCYNELVFPLYLRNRENGDRIKLSIGTKKIKDILIDQKVPQKVRENLILLANNDKVLWIPNIKKSLQDLSCKKKLYVYEVKRNVK